MKMKNRIISVILATVMLFAAMPVMIAGDGYMQSFINLTVGADQSMINLTWYSDTDGEGSVIYCKASDVVDNGIPMNIAMTATATTEIADEGEGYYSYKAILTDLEPDTEYAYFLINNGYAEKLRYFTTGDEDEFGFALVSDIQIGSGGIDHDTEGWQNTLDIIAKDAAFDGTDFILSTGDQVQDSGNESQYDAFINQELLTSMPIATTIGNHDTSAPLYSLHFNPANMSKQYGVTEAGGDSWFRYNNALFIILNTNAANVDDHIEFARQAVAMNMDADWRILAFHHTVYTSGELKDSRTGRGEAVIDICNELDIDVAVAGHEHLYTRTYIMKNDEPIKDSSLYGENYSSITDPDGTLFITNNTGSGCKYDDILPPNPDFVAVTSQEHIPYVTKVEIDDDSFDMKVYRTSDMSIVDSFTINKTGKTSNLPFNDVKENHWYYSAVDYVYGKGMMSGMSETEFGPNIPTNRAMLVSVLWRYEGSPEGYSHSFSDVKSTHYFDKAVAWAYENNIVAGKTETAYAPNDKLTREQMAAILYRYAAYAGKDTTAETELTAFADLDKLDAYAVDAMKWAYGKGIITGMNDTTLDPNGNATRAQLASILMRFLKPKKYFTLSFDDGITQDLKIIEILKKYDVDCMTFNINTEGLYGVSWPEVGIMAGVPGLSHLRFTKEELESGIYDGYDVAVHTRTHPSLKNFDTNPVRVIEEVQGNADDIAEITGIAPVGMAWPGGDTEYTDTTIDIILENTDIRYARGTTSTLTYELPTQFMKWMPTCHMVDGNLLTYATNFIELEPEEDSLFYVWGHGYELDAYDLYDEFEVLVRLMKQYEGEITLVTNTEFYELYKNQIPSV